MLNLTLNPRPQTEHLTHLLALPVDNFCEQFGPRYFMFIVFSLILIASESPVFKTMLSHIMRFHVKFNVESPSTDRTFNSLSPSVVC